MVNCAAGGAISSEARWAVTVGSAAILSRRWGRLTESLAELRAIMNAVKARDADAVANACLYHISRAGQAGIDALPEPPTGA